MQDASIIKLYRTVRVILFRGLEGPEAEGTVKGWKPRKRGDAKPEGNYENIKVSHAQSRSKKKLVGVALQVPREEKRRST